MALIVSSFAAESDNMDPPQFECVCGGGCIDSKPGFMMEDEERKCCKSSGWTDLNISGNASIWYKLPAVHALHSDHLILNPLLELSCMTEHPLLEKLLDRDVLEVMLHMHWERTRGGGEITHKYLEHLHQK